MADIGFTESTVTEELKIDFPTNARHFTHVLRALSPMIYLRYIHMVSVLMSILFKTSDIVLS